MKKILLLAACATMMASAQVQNPTLTKLTDAKLPATLATNEVRQGFGMNGKFYIQNKATKQVEIYNTDGTLHKVFAPSGPSTAISYDHAGNIIVGVNKFPGAFRTDTAQIKVISADGATSKDLTIPELIKGRCDFFGVALGNLLQEGVLAASGDKSTELGIINVKGGVVNADDSFGEAITGATFTSSTVTNTWIDANGDEHFLFVTRNAKPLDLIDDGGNVKVSPLTLPKKGASNGAMAFALGGKNFIVYPTTPNYQDAFAIAELTAGENGMVAGAEAVLESPSTVAANPNGIQANWLNVEANAQEKVATIYQYVPGLGIRTYKFELPASTGVENVNAQKAVAGVKYVNPQGIESNQPFDGMNIVVTTYTDGSHSSTKVVK